MILQVNKSAANTISLGAGKAYVQLIFLRLPKTHKSILRPLYLSAVADNALMVRTSTGDIFQEVQL